jgi:hypothetical protein
MNTNNNSVYNDLLMRFVCYLNPASLFICAYNIAIVCPAERALFAIGVFDWATIVHTFFRARTFYIRLGQRVHSLNNKQCTRALLKCARTEKSVHKSGPVKYTYCQ